MNTIDGYNTSTTVSYNQEDVIRDFLMGQTVRKVSGDTLLLSNGTILQIEPNEGCGGCISGWYQLDELNECPDNAIMNVEFVEEEDQEPYSYSGSYKVFVLAADRRIKLWEVSGDDGNGYYGSGYWINVRFPND